MNRAHLHANVGQKKWMRSNSIRLKKDQKSVSGSTLGAIFKLGNLFSSSIVGACCLPGLETEQERTSRSVIGIFGYTIILKMSTCAPTCLKKLVSRISKTINLLI